jgi:hypothetical protein
MPYSLFLSDPGPIANRSLSIYATFSDLSCLPIDIADASVSRIRRALLRRCELRH